MTRGRPLPRLHLVTDDRLLADANFGRRAAALLEAGGSAVALHLRGPRTAGRVLFEHATRLAAFARRSGGVLLVNDRVDVALAAGADGVQLGGRSLETAAARGLLGDERWIGRSVHGAEEARGALAGGADFVLAGNLYATATHPGQAGAGLDWLRRIPGGAERVIGIGGVTPGRAAEVRAAPAYGVAVIRAVWDDARPEEALERFVNCVHERDASE